MYSKALSLFFFFGLWSCSDKALLEKSPFNSRLSGLQWSIDKVSEGTWKVGPRYRQMVSKNLVLVLSLPTIAKEDMSYLQQTYGVDSWVVKIIQLNPEGRMELAQLLAPFYSQPKSRAGQLTIRAVSFALTYAASAISERFRRFQCPAFSHSRRLDEWKVVGEPNTLDMTINSRGRFTEKLVTSELVPIALNIGHSMIGEYYFEVALYGSHRKELYSPFQRLPQSLKVIREETVEIEGCAGVHQEYQTPQKGVIN